MTKDEKKKNVGKEMGKDFEPHDEDSYRNLVES
jgi:hypothetical protein